MKFRLKTLMVLLLIIVMIGYNIITLISHGTEFLYVTYFIVCYSAIAAFCYKAYLKGIRRMNKAIYLIGFWFMVLKIAFNILTILDPGHFTALCTDAKLTQVTLSAEVFITIICFTYVYTHD